ncbi:butyrophilin subfamily 2 member A1-like isoform X3 [Bos taurus]|uniref:butyrophilin subfamily 2 member A1-like isoform X3 n=1 Tax=Bos taurus TaxID=9913 RepID=UPI0028CB331A|nr:butyrophilin subfamily 2 member A1-like isoform X3 [Bos taurus]
MRKSQEKPASEQRWPYEKPEEKLADIRKKFEPTRDGPQVKNVTEFKPDVHHSGEDHIRNHIIQMNDHGKIFEIHENSASGFKSQVLDVGMDQNRNSQNQDDHGKVFGSRCKSPVLHSDVDQKRNIPNQGLLGNKIVPQESSEKSPVKSGDLLRKLDKGEQERDDLLRKLEKTPKKDDDFQKTFDKGEQDKDKIKQEKDKIAQEKDISQDNLEELLNAAEQLQKAIEKEEAQFKSDWRKEEFQTVNLTLDAATAHPALFLSEEGRRVTWQEPRQDLPSCSQRFTSLTCVLGQLHVSSKRYFWEVEVGDAHSWDLGVCRDNVTRNGRVKMSPQNGFWAIRLYEGEYWGLTSPETYLTLKEKPCRLGVFLDYEAGDVSFYNMADGSHIFTFSEQAFYGVLRPLFRLQASDSGSLTIVQVE